MPSRAAYDDSVLDLERLSRYARRVARETSLPLAEPIRYEKVTETVEVAARYRRTVFGGTRRVSPERRTRRTNVVEVVGAHWLISSRRWHHDEITQHDGSTLQEETHFNHYLVLTPEGEILDAWTKHAIAVQWGQKVGNGTLWEEFDHSVSRASESDICALDFERYHQSFERRTGRTRHVYWQDRDPGRRLLKHAKGVGINLALKSILEGRTPQGT